MDNTIQPNSEKASYILEQIEEKSLNPGGVTDEDYNNMQCDIKTQEDLVECIPHFKREIDLCKENIAKSDENIKLWQSTKNMWQNRQACIVAITGMLLSKLKLKDIKSGDVKVWTKTTNSLEVDEETILKQYEQLIAVTQAQLPDYIKLSVGIDKTKLTAAVQTNPSIMNNNVNAMRWRQKQSITMK